MVEEATGKPAPGALIVIVGTQFRAATDSTGAYRITRVPLPQGGDYTVEARNIGRIPERRDVGYSPFRSDTTYRLNFYLRPAPISLEF